MKFGLYMGTASDPVENIHHLLESWGEYVGDAESEFELYGSAELPEGIKKHFGYVRTTQREPSGAIGRIQAAFLDTKEYVERESPAAVGQIWRYKTHAPGLALASQRLGVPVVTRYNGDTFSEYEYYDGKRRAMVFGLDHIIGRLPLQLATRTIVFGPYGEQQLRTRGIPSERLHQIPPPISAEQRFSPPNDREAVRQKLNLPLHKPVFLFVGRLSGQKGMNFLQNVVEQTQSESNALFVLVGEGPWKERFEEEYPQAVRPAGYIPHNQIHQYYQAADAYVHPSEYEGLPLVILEALQCGTPVVARRAGDVGLVTDNIVDHPEEMASWLTRGSWEFEWKNERMFSKQYQRKRLVRVFKEAAGKT